MPADDPVSLTFAIIAATVGAALGGFILVRLARELRARKQLRAQGPDFDEYDRDVRRYLERVWLLVSAWKPRLSAEAVAELDMLWEDALRLARELQDSRARDEEVAPDVAKLVELEARVESVIEEARNATS